MPALAARLAEAGLSPDDLVDVAALDRLPVLSKDDLIDLQAKDAAVRRPARPGHQGPADLPVAGPALRAGARRTPTPGGRRRRWRRPGSAAGDTVLNCFGYHLSPGRRHVRGGGPGPRLPGRARRGGQLRPGRPGRPRRRRHRLHRPPQLPEGPAGEGRGAGRAAAAVRAGDGDGGAAAPLACGAGWRSGSRSCARCTARPSRAAWASSARRVSGLHVPDDALVEVCALDDGSPRLDGGEGQVVVTVFSPHYPLVRFGTGDLSAFASGDCPCGRSTPRPGRLAGALGRGGEGPGHVPPPPPGRRR